MARLLPLAPSVTFMWIACRRRCATICRHSSAPARRSAVQLTFLFPPNPCSASDGSAVQHTLPFPTPFVPSLPVFLLHTQLPVAPLGCAFSSSTFPGDIAAGRHSCRACPGDSCQVRSALHLQSPLCLPSPCLHIPAAMLQFVNAPSSKSDAQQTGPPKHWAWCRVNCTTGIRKVH